MTEALLGAAMPRLYTSPLRALGPATSLGPECIRFAETVLGVKLDPWQRNFLLHALELMPDGSFRYRTVVLLVARQNGKTLLMSVLMLWAMYTGRTKLVLGAAQNLVMARETWEACVDMASEACYETRSLIANVRRANGEQELRLNNGCRYKITAVSRSAGRGLSVDLLFLDELREHRTWDGWGALQATTTARPNALTVCTSNAGDDQSVVLNKLRQTALDGLDETIGIFEWSAPDGCELDDRSGWAQANPALGHGRLTERVLESVLASDPANVFRTERLCQRVAQLETAVDFTGWQSGADKSGSLKEYRDRLVAGIDVSLDGAHVTLYAAAALPDGKVRIEEVASWYSTEDCRLELEGLLNDLGAQSLAWQPTGPAAALAPILAARPESMPLQGSDVTTACQVFADLVKAGRVLHKSAPLLDAQLSGASRTKQGDGFRFTRRGAGTCDAVYAAAAAVYAAQVLPEPKKKWAGAFVV